MDRCLIIIPTYNEIENIGRLVDKIFSLPVPFDILVVDDNSPDGTGEFVMNLKSKSNGALSLLSRSGKLGLGTAYVLGFEWAISKGYGYIFEMDADFSHDPDDLLLLYQACKEGNDVAIGSRYVDGRVSVVNWPMSRLIMSCCASFYARQVTRMNIRDATAGFVCYRASLLEKVNLKKIRFSGYAFQIEMKYIAYQLGAKIKEVPVIFRDRTEGVSKMNSAIFREGLFGVLSLRLNGRKFYVRTGT